MGKFRSIPFWFLSILPSADSLLPTPTLSMPRAVGAQTAGNVQAEVAGIITLDDDDDEVEEGEIEGADSEENEKKELRSIPYKNAAVSLYDYRTLEEEHYINDGIIDFYLLYLYQEKLNPEYRNDIHIFSSHFYSRLTSVPKKTNDGISRSKAKRAYECVKNWTKKVDLFSKRMIVVPICEDSHWYVVVVCNAGSIAPSNSRDQGTHGKPYFLVLDSLGDAHETAVSNLRSFLRLEYQDKRRGAIVFSNEKMAVHTPEVPTQQNSCDCGLFLLHYVELIFEDPEKFYFSTATTKLRRWFSPDDLRNKRAELAQLIQHIASESPACDGIEFPNIKLPVTRSRRRARALKEERKKTSTCEDDTELSPAAFAKQVLSNSEHFSDVWGGSSSGRGVRDSGKGQKSNGCEETADLVIDVDRGSLDEHGLFDSPKSSRKKKKKKPDRDFPALECIEIVPCRSRKGKKEDKEETLSSLSSDDEPLLPKQMKRRQKSRQQNAHDSFHDEPCVSDDEIRERLTSKQKSAKSCHDDKGNDQDKVGRRLAESQVSVASDATNPLLTRSATSVGSSKKIQSPHASERKRRKFRLVRDNLFVEKTTL